MGGGTTLIEAWLLGRYSVGIDISKLAYQSTIARLEHMQLLSEEDSRVNIDSKYKPRLIFGDSTFVEDSTCYKTIRPGSVNLLCVHPPYLDVLNYTNGNPKDLSQIKDPDSFLKRIATFAGSLHGVFGPY